jgi:hypothetical protein
MGTISFLLPEDLPPHEADELACACIAGGPDNMPWPSDTVLDANFLTIRRSVDESGYLQAPWRLPEIGSLMGSSSTLMERDTPYEMLVELARGKVNQVRCQMQDWCMGGLQVSAEMQESVQRASSAFGRSVLAELPAERILQVRSVLDSAYRAADRLVRTYIDQVLHIRHQHQVKLETLLGSRLRAPLQGDEEAALLGRASNSVVIALPWHQLEPAQGQYFWGPFDALVESATDQKLQIGAGPLIDFSPANLPDWIFQHENEPQRLAHCMGQFVETVVNRYHGKIRRWQLCSGSNWGNALRLGEDDLLWLTVRLIEAARQIDPRLELTVGLVQPWGEYMAVEERLHSPFIFADTLTRAGANLAALDLELVMGVTPRGSYCRDLLETSRLIDLYALLGTPLHITLGYPSAAGSDPQADPALRVGSGAWRGGPLVDSQADWAASFAALAISKPSVQAVHWIHFSDREPHQFPNCGLLDSQGRPRPALEQLQRLRETHLR